MGAICCIRSILQEWAIFKAQNFLHVTPGSTWLNQMRRHQHRRHPCQLAPCPLVRTLLTQTTMINSIGETPVPQHPCVLKSRQRQLPWQTDLPIGWNHPTCYFWFLRLVLILVILQMLLNPNWQYPTCVVFFGWTKEIAAAAPSAQFFAEVGATFTADGFDWGQLKSHGLFYRCQRSEHMLCGKLLAHCKAQVSTLREEIGVRICCFKIGITSNPPLRFSTYLEKNYSCMWVIAVSKSVDQINMLEAAVISEFQKHVGCKNEPDTGGEGALNRKNRTKPPYYLYVTAGRADKSRWVG